MAASLVMCSRCARKLKHIRVNRPLALRPLCTAPSKSSSDEVEDRATFDLEALYTSSRKRDPFAVLRALESTVKPTHFMPNPEFIEDANLLPKKRDMKEKCFWAKRSGVEAAKFVISNCPGIFPLWNANPAWKVDAQTVADDDIQTEDQLKALIEDHKARKAAQIFEKFKEQGVEVSLETQNLLLDLVAYKLGTESAEKTLTSEERSEYLETSDADTDESTMGSDDELSTPQNDGDRDTLLWNSDNYAEQLFKSMMTKDGRTYEAMILGLIKFRAYKRAFDMLIDGMRANGHQASLLTYNYLIKGISRLANWEMVQILIKEMGKAPVVIPDIVTFNSLMRTAVVAVEEGQRTRLVLSLIRDMKDLGITPSMETYHQLLRAEYLPFWQKKNARRKNKQPLQKMFANPAVLDLVVTQLESLPNLPPIVDPEDTNFFTTAMSAAVICIDADLAIRVYNLAEKENNAAFLGVKYSRFYATFFVALSVSDVDFHILYKYYKEVIPEKIRPKPYVYVTILNQAFKTQQSKVAVQLYEDMQKFKVAITENVVSALFKNLVAAEKPEDLKKNLEVMLDVLHWVDMFKLRIHPMTISLIVRMYSVNDKLEMAWNTLAMYKKAEAFPHFSSLLNILNLAVKKGDQTKVVATFELMAKYGYEFNGRRRFEYYNAANLSRNDRKHIDKLFESLEVLDDNKRKTRNVAHNLPDKDDALEEPTEISEGNQ
ncbi:pentatricopeptide repeat domain-containing protein 3, mitochondrial-like [Stylophora pistillata]|uniref:Small ribosomal subunit protein mS39 n=1 Tax=Stylophora pistillata TaxID=50429 RepID=A0A2B4SVV3_STYPI|nr:pentatricopeptide repeat domain-containing protein 3, mitochondrial-like [Stylophora pistillata]PFX32587.1 Pentatricopeptide repeat domain-containing protein 3, mitochondrial [Stylophora pistillata]